MKDFQGRIFNIDQSFMNILWPSLKERLIIKGKILMLKEVYMVIRVFINQRLSRLFLSNTSHQYGDIPLRISCM